MPLQDLIPVIDDRRFDDIMAEVRTRIVRYTPEWTDLNENDPGIVLSELFAWMTELLLYRLGKVPEANYIKFLQLLGIELRPAESATTEITFPLQPTAAPTVIVPARTQVSASPPGGGKPILFETDRALIALAASLDAVLAFDGYGYADVSADNAVMDPGGYQPFGPLATPGSALLFGFKASSPFPKTSIDLAVFCSDTEHTRTARFADCGLPATQAYPSAKIQWEYWNGKVWLPLDLLKDETLAFTRSGHIVLQYAPSVRGPLLPSPMGPITTGLFWIQGRLVSSQYEQIPNLSAVRTNTVTATQAETAHDEVLGGSDGMPNQTKTLQYAPVLAGSLRLQVNQDPDPNVWTDWIEVGDFFASQPTDLHYVLDRTSGTIRFGDGTHGSIPIANVDNATANIVAREYRYGGGASGNLAASLVKTVVTSVDGLDENSVKNWVPAVGGRDEESLTDAKLRAPQALKNQCRAVTTDDYESLAKQAANIKRARALPLFHPDFPGIKVPGVMTVIVVPDSTLPDPTPSEGTLRTVCAYLSQRRLLTTELYVVKPTYQKLTVAVQAKVSSDADLGAVKQSIQQALTTYFDPLKGGEDGQGWPFGGTVYYSRIYHQVFTAQGVLSIDHLVLTLDGEEQLECANVPLGANALISLAGLDIQVDYDYGS